MTAHTLCAHTHTAVQWAGMATHVGELESGFIRVLKPIHLHHTIVPPYHNITHTVPGEVAGSNGSDPTISSLVEHVPAIVWLV